jgi:iron complex outermembrane receptor protein
LVCCCDAVLRIGLLAYEVFVVLRSSVIVVLLCSRTVVGWAQPASDAGVPDAPPADAPSDAAPPGDAPSDAAPPADAVPTTPTPSPTPAPQAACTGTVDGHAVDAATHEPVVAATVSSGETMLATTDDAGRFTLTGQCPGTLTIIVERDDYKPAPATIQLTGHASVEVQMHTSGEVIEIHDKPPPPPEMRSEAVISGAKLEKSRGKTFTAAIAEVPGVTELKASTGVAKPIIRGQFGRRLLMLVDGVRHRAQEWGLEHAPEIDSFSAGTIRVVRGAGGVRYGPDAIGGVVLVDPPEMRRDPGYNGEAHLVGASNGRGGTFAGRLQGVAEQLPALSMQLEGSIKRQAAPLTPDYALDNTGLFEWNAGAAAVYRAHNSEYKLSFHHYDATLGVCSCLRVHNIDDFLAQATAGEPIGVDEFHSDFAIDRPRQSVGHDLAIARGRWERDHLGAFTVTYSFQNDLRQEYEVVRNADIAGPQFKFHLMSHELESLFEHNPIHLSEHWHLRGAAGIVGLAQIHDYSGLHLIPDYTAGSGGVFASERLVGHATELEAGARYDYLARTAKIEKLDFQRLVRSGQLANDACGADIDPARCKSHFQTFVGSLGALQRFADVWSLKGELSAASRAPDPDEQYLNGAAPTFPVLGLGKPDLKPETTYSSSLTVSYDTTAVKAEASAYVNRIDNYIYFGPAIGPDGMPILDVTIRGTYPRFTTHSVDADFVGADGGVEVAPTPALELGVQASFIRAKNADDGSYLVFIPADHYRASATYHPPDVGSLRKNFATLTGTYVAKQTRYDSNADFIPPPPAYFLLGAEIGTETTLDDQTAKIALEGANLTNARYRDYTSLNRYFADEPGWQLWLRLSVFFDSTKKGAAP